jgi:hypothetical protein
LNDELDDKGPILVTESSRGVLNRRRTLVILRSHPVFVLKINVFLGSDNLASFKQSIAYAV